MLRKILNPGIIADMAFGLVTTAGSYAVAANKLKNPSNQNEHRMFTHSKSAAGAAMHMKLRQEKTTADNNTTAPSNKK